VHEFSIAQSLVEAAAAEAARHGASRVVSMRCRIGALRQVDGWLMQEAFQIAREGSICADCELAIDKTFMQAYCPACQARYAVENWDWLCPTCGAEGQNPVGGDELELVSIEVELPDGDNRPQERIPAE
jgi:hydrogenase nickel incorporation protein HypA/HybF